MRLARVLNSRNIPYKLHCYFLSTSISFLYSLSRSTRNNGKKNATGTSFELEEVTQFIDFRALNLHLEVNA